MTINILALYFINTLSGQIIDNFEKARYAGEFPKVIYETVRYPIESLKVQEQGEVIISLDITSEGDLRNMKVIQAASPFLAKSALESMSTLNGKWTPTHINGQPVSHPYLLVFNFRIYLEKPPNTIQIIEKLIRKGKHEKAVKKLSLEINSNSKSANLYKLRAAQYEALGKEMESDQDLERQIMLDQQVLEVISVKALGKSRIQKITRYN